MRSDTAKMVLCRTVFIALALFLLPFSVSAQRASEVFEGEYIIQRQQSDTPTIQSDAYQTVSHTSFSSLVRPKTRANSFQSAGPTKQIVPYNPVSSLVDCAKIMQADPTVRTCEPNFVKYLADTFPNDPLFYPYQCLTLHYSPFADGVSSYDLRSHKAWDVTTGSKQIVLGVLDSGINYRHPDLIPNIWVNPKETANNNIDDDGNGYVDDVIGIDAFKHTNDNFDCNGHGSHVSGIIGAKGNNNVGLTGVNWDTSIIMAKTAPDCGPSISTAAVLAGFDYFYDLKSREGVNLVAVNGSYGGPNFTQAEHDAIARLGRVNVVFVAAAGNDGIDIDKSPRYPAAYDVDTMLTIANINTDSIPAVLNESSNYGAVAVDFGAPGTNILSTVFAADPGADFGGGNETYGTKTGTSMAAPTVTGAIGLAVAKYPQLNTARAIVAHMMGTTYQTSILQGRARVAGILNLFNVVSMALPQDQCPNDANKLEAGTCGCGVADNYTDSDRDGFPDCIDTCASDPNKSAPGTCGCGVSDADGDGDGVVNCLDLCMTDPGKSAPGSCGCGVADSDANANGKLDCVDATITAETPKPPKIKIVNGKLEITMSDRTGGGVQFKITITTKISKKKTKVTVIMSNKKITKIKVPKGLSSTIQYSWVIPGEGEFTSTISKGKKI